MSVRSNVGKKAQERREGTDGEAEGSGHCPLVPVAFKSIHES
jgi:hypothetical protein